MAGNLISSFSESVGEFISVSLYWVFDPANQHLSRTVAQFPISLFMFYLCARRLWNMNERTPRALRLCVLGLLAMSLAGILTPFSHSLFPPYQWGSIVGMYSGAAIIWIRRATWTGPNLEWKRSHGVPRNEDTRE